jgi:5-methylcytosine-specific restriction protein A
MARRLKEKIHLRDNWTCQHCRRVTAQLELDHIVNVAQGGTDDESNLQSLCPPCHKDKESAVV